MSTEIFLDYCPWPAKVVDVDRPNVDYYEPRPVRYDYPRSAPSPREVVKALRCDLTVYCYPESEFQRTFVAYGWAPEIRTVYRRYLGSDVRNDFWSPWDAL